MRIIPKKVIKIIKMFLCMPKSIWSGFPYKKEAKKQLTNIKKIQPIK